MVSLTCRSIVIFTLLLTFTYCLWVAFSHLLWPDIGMTLKKTKEGEMPSLTICPLDYAGKDAIKWQLKRGNHSFADILSILPNLKDYLEFSLYDANNTTEM